VSTDTLDLKEPLWFRVQIERKALKKLQGRSDLPGLAHFGAYVAGMVLFGALTVTDVLPTWARIVAFLAYATVFCFSEAILHETHHRTAFRTSWVNETVHYIVGVLAFKEPIRDRWLHAAHHTYTSYPDIDPETLLEPPPSFRTLGLDFFRLRFVCLWLGATLQLSVGSIDVLTERFVPPAERRKVVWSARAGIAFYAAIALSAIIFNSWWPIVLFFVARFAGAPLHSWLTMTQHAGLATNVSDWRENTRTVLVSRLNRLLMWNMNYHLEHHMNPTVPFHRLPDLHKEIDPECPAPYRSSWAAWREMLPALWRQRRDPSYYVRRAVPVPADATTEGK
jgi:fatty acid desaturase